jgi:predicted phosphodiesterase
VSTIWFCGDVHGEFGHVLKTIEETSLGDRPAAVIFLGDLDPPTPLSEIFSAYLDVGISPWFVHGNHEGDDSQTWTNTLDCWERNIHGRVETIAGVRIAGLGGVFRNETWYPPSEPKFHSYDDYVRYLTSIQPGRLRDEVGASKRARVASSSIFPSVVEALSGQRADVLVTHEAPACHADGFSVIDNLARSLGVEKVFNGHHHNDQHRSAEGFEAFQVGLRGIRELSGGIVRIGEFG